MSADDVTAGPAGSPAASLGGADALSAVSQDYLKVIWAATEWEDRPVTTKLLAGRLGVGASTVSETVRRLADSGLVTHEPYGAVGLTEQGRLLALAMVRRHRLVETFLVQVLGYGWDEVHDEAEVLEHAVSEVFVERLAAHLGHPTRDPHGDPIPGSDGTFAPPPATALWEASAGHWQVARISDADPELLRHVDAVGLVLDAPVEVVARRDAIGLVSLLVGPERAPTELGEVAARSIWLVAAD